MATYTSNNYEGRTLKLEITETINTVANKSTLKWTLTSAGGSSNYYTIGATTVIINGTTVYSKDQTEWDSRVFPAAKGSVSGSIDVGHNNDGTKSVTVVFKTRVYQYDPVDYGGTMSLTKIDRSAPSVSVTASNITAHGVKLSVSASTKCDIWQYSIDNGSSWITFDSSEGTSKGHDILGLNANTEYKIRAKARKQSNQVYGTSGTTSVKTLGGSVLSSAENIVADASVAKITMTATVYNQNYTHTVKILVGSSTIVTLEGIALSSGVKKTINLTAGQRSTLLNAMKTIKATFATVQLITYSGSSQIGDVSSKSIMIITTAANSAPTLSGFTYADINTTAVGVTGNNQILIQAISNLSVNIQGATAKNGASISSYTVTIGDRVASSISTGITINGVNTAGTVPLIVTAVDSRGYTDSATVNVTVLEYERIRLSEIAMRRINEVETTCEVSVSGKLSPVVVAGEEKNTFRDLRVRYKKTSDTNYSAYQTISGVDATGNEFLYESEEFLLLSLDADYSYDVQFCARDQITSDTSTVTIPQGTPIISLRRKRVGINNRDPEAGLDVNGGIIINGVEIDYIVDQGTSGIWQYRKWNSGIAECWGVKTGTVSLTKSAESPWYTHEGAVEVSLPTIFAENPVVQINPYRDTAYYAHTIAVTFISATLIRYRHFDLASFDYEERTFISVHGKWK